MVDVTGDPYAAVPGFLTVVMALGANKFASFVSAPDVGPFLARFEATCGVRPGDATSAERQMALRAEVVRGLLGPSAVARWNDFANLACLWLAVNHHGGDGAIGRAIASSDLEGKGAVLSVGCLAEAPTAWAFVVGPRAHDARPALRPGEAGCRVLEGAEAATVGTPLEVGTDRVVVTRRVGGLPDGGPADAG